MDVDHVVVVVVVVVVMVVMTMLQRFYIISVNQPCSVAQKWDCVTGYVLYQHNGLHHLHDRRHNHHHSVVIFGIEIFIFISIVRQKIWSLWTPEDS